MRCVLAQYQINGGVIKVSIYDIVFVAFVDIKHHLR